MNTQLGELLKHARQLIGKTIKQISDETGVDRTVLCRMENNHRKCPRKKVMAIALAYGLTKEQILSAGLSVDSAVMTENIAGLFFLPPISIHRHQLARTSVSMNDHHRPVWIHAPKDFNDPMICLISLRFFSDTNNKVITAFFDHRFFARVWLDSDLDIHRAVYRKAGARVGWLFMRNSMEK
ncbi:helix-turn-helix domain-containing protein [Patescibacteria group bacterium]|nr:helix-turn-helix domain-containing protein [Patescibacteria group bacterium]MDE1946510.1 helix-turn-helix transcriptional regulator [Patescibacteria group bacterium]MDE2011245.1 helix-turn-helix transcriptional regulator [Patescibacteria group bacterium]MDE2233328.1 helix-turn-helix transcriptional regulator [Patescibacteria group bacterium]